MVICAVGVTERDPSVERAARDEVGGVLLRPRDGAGLGVEADGEPEIRATNLPESTPRVAPRSRARAKQRDPVARVGSQGASARRPAEPASGPGELAQRERDVRRFLLDAATRCDRRNGKRRARRR